jgi:tRNA1Val (adenine37-N6)-methyltransferase
MKQVRDFRFKQFTVSQHGSTHKVGTDGVLLGAWVNVEGRKRILEIGTGSGVIALMLAQRTPSDALIDAVEIQHEDAIQAKENSARSAWKERIFIYETSIQNFDIGKKYNLIVSNPPFFVNSWLPPSGKRTIVRHTENLTFDELLEAVTRMLASDGLFAVILPHAEALVLIEKAKALQLNNVRQCAFRSRAHKPIERLLLEFSYGDHPTVLEQLVLHGEGEEWSDDYKRLTQDFYLKI